MISICPNCYSQFNVDSKLLGAAGRTVRCSSCENTWFQEPDLAELEAMEDVVDNSAESAQVADDILAEPVEDEGDISAPSKILKNPARNKKLSYAVAASVFFVIFAYLMMNGTSIMRRSPASYAFYNLFGMGVELAGEGLVFDRVVAEMRGGGVFVSGTIINITSDTKAVPAIEVAVLDHGSDEILDEWLISIPKDVLEAEDVINFSAQNGVEHVLETSRLRVRFSLADVVKDDVIGIDDAEEASAHGDDSHGGAKTGEEDGGSNLAPHGGGSGH